MNSTVVKAFQILDYIAEHQGDVRLVDIVTNLNMNKTTGFRFLETLEHLNLIEKKGANYYLGLGLLFLGQKVHTQKLLINRLNPLMKLTATEVNETINLAMFQNNHALYLHKVESSRRVQFRAKPGDRLQLYCTALGKAILSILKPDDLRGVLAGFNYKPQTRNTILTEKDLLTQIDIVKQKGWAKECQEIEDGLNCVAVPLYLPGINFFGAVSMSGTTVRFTPERQIFLGRKLIEMVEEVYLQFNSKQLS